MWKYYALLFVAVGLVLAYVYVADPCNRLLRTDFMKANPSYVILDSNAESGAPESVHCRISYKKPGDDLIYEDVWVYMYGETSWEFSGIAESGRKKQASP